MRVTYRQVLPSRLLITFRATPDPSHGIHWWWVGRRGPNGWWKRSR